MAAPLVNNESPSPDAYNYDAIERDIRNKVRDLLPGREDVQTLLDNMKTHNEYLWKEFLFKLYSGAKPSIYGSDRDWYPHEGDLMVQFERVFTHYGREPKDPLTLDVLNASSFDPIGLVPMNYTDPKQLLPGVLITLADGRVVRVTRVGRNHKMVYYDMIRDGQLETGMSKLTSVNYVYGAAGAGAAGGSRTRRRKRKTRSRKQRRRSRKQ